MVVGAVMSVLTGVGLWAVLPRGVVLTRAVRAQGHDGRPRFDTWEIRNNSPLPVTITSVRYRGANTYDDKSGRIPEVDLPVFEGEGDLGISLTFDDEVAEIRRFDMRQSWRGMTVPPGDTLEARVLNNRDLVIGYRRSGLFGVFERRRVEIHGTV